MRIYDNIAYGLKLKRLRSEEISERVFRTLDLVNLKGLEKRYPGQLSGGHSREWLWRAALVLNPTSYFWMNR